MTPFTVLYQDDSLMVLSKSAGVVVDPSETQTEGTVAHILIEQFGNNLERGGVVHRLDKDTSGLLLIAKTTEALSLLQAQFKDRMVKKKYLCLVHGWIEKGGRVEGAIGRNPGDREKFIVVQGGKEASTEYQPIELKVMTEEVKQRVFADFNKIQRRKLDRADYGRFTYVRCFPLTGRTHQIRVHLKYLGFPLVGDSKYGGRKTARLDARWCSRQFLHAESISFVHPKTGEQMNFTDPLPPDLQQALDILVTSNQSQE